MTTLREAAQQALEAMGSVGADWICEASHHAKKDQHKGGEPCPLQQRWHVAYQALRAALVEEALQRFTDVNQELEAALAEPVQEPVAWMVYTLDGKSVCVTDNPADFIEWRSLPLYTSPPQRKPLSDDEIAQAMYRADAIFTGPMQFRFARAIERAHGIT